MAMTTLHVFIVLFFASGGSSEVSQSTVDYIAENLKVTFEVVNNLIKPVVPPPADDVEARITLNNQGGESINQDAWEIYFYSIYLVEPQLDVINGADVPGTGLTFHHIDGMLYKFTPNKDFKPIAGGGKQDITLRIQNWMVSRSDFMPRWFVTGDQLKSKQIASTEDLSVFVGDFASEEQYKRYEDDQYEPYSPKQRLDRYNFTAASDEWSADVIPKPLSATKLNGSVVVTSDWTVDCGEPTFSTECCYLADYFGIPCNDTNEFSASGDDGKFSFTIGNVDVEVAGICMQESYLLNITSGNIIITSPTAAGTFYAIQTLISLTETDDTNGNGKWILDEVVIKDGPRFEYRGMHLDVARNFHSKDDVIDIIEVMAMYKLNQLHLHLTDDEGWRLQLKSWPELTDVGGQRAFDTTGERSILPQLGSGPDNDTSGSGFYTEVDYKEILNAAVKNHVRVIPELDLPGHAHAAIQSNLRRYKELKDEDLNKAENILISDLNDTSGTLSAQYYRDNAVNPCINGTYSFIRDIVKDVIKLHNGTQDLEIFHLGGDEVPKVWIESPKCNELINNTAGFPRSTSDLLEYFLRNASVEITNLNASLKLALWEDGAVNEENPFEKDDVYKGDIIAYAWQDVWEFGMANRAYKLANADYKVVLASATHLYFDQPYEPDPEEPGYYWASRFTDTHKTFGYMPDDVYANCDAKRSGDPYDETELCTDHECTPLEEEKRENIIGIQGELWSETVRSSDRLHYMIFPRFIALAERAWHKADWETTDGPSSTTNQRDNDWTRFATILGRKELRRLDTRSISYRLAPPGAIISDENDMETGCEFPGMIMRYRVEDIDGWNNWNEVVCGTSHKIPSNFTNVELQSVSSVGARYSRPVFVKKANAKSNTAKTTSFQLGIILSVAFFVLMLCSGA